MKKMVESPMMVVRRPNRSEMRPHPSAPIAAAKASDAGGKTPLRLVLKGGGQIVYNGYPSLNKTPEMTRNQIMAVTLAYAVSGPAARY